MIVVHSAIDKSAVKFFIFLFEVNEVHWFPILLFLNLLFQANSRLLVFFIFQMQTHFFIWKSILCKKNLLTIHTSTLLKTHYIRGNYFFLEITANFMGNTDLPLIVQFRFAPLFWIWTKKSLGTFLEKICSAKS